MKPIRFKTLDCANIGVFVDDVNIANMHFWLPDRPDWASINDSWDNCDKITRCLNEMVDDSDDFDPLIRFVHNANQDFVTVNFRDEFPLEDRGSNSDIPYGNTKDYTGLVVNAFQSVWDRNRNKPTSSISGEKIVVARQNANDAIWFMNQLDD